jgi:hypothetical protein
MRPRGPNRIWSRRGYLKEVVDSYVIPKILESSFVDFVISKYLAKNMVQNLCYKSKKPFPWHFFGKDEIFSL